MLGPDGVGVHGVSPVMVLQPNGTLLMTTGRPEVRVYVSNDGTGKTWDKAITASANYPSTGGNGRYDGSSGNNSLESVGANTSVLFYDLCMVWGCGAYNQQFGLSAQYVTAVTPRVGKIDVASKLLDGTAPVSGNFAGANKRFPEQRPAGAFDGSSEVGAVAVLRASSSKAPEMVLRLDREYSSNKIGSALFTFGVNGTAADGSSVPAWDFRLQPGNPATLQANDGTSWQTVATFPGALPSKTYLPLTIDATTDSATVSLGTSSFTTKARAAQTSDLADLHVSTGDPAVYGGIYYPDDVSVSADPGTAPQLGVVSFYPVQAAAAKPLVVSTTLTNPGTSRPPTCQLICRCRKVGPWLRGRRRATSPRVDK